MRQSVLEFCASCQSCALRNAHGQRARPELKPTEIPLEPWSRVSSDILKMPISEDYQYILVLQCYFSKFACAIPLKKMDAESVASAFVQLFSVVGVPAEILSDQGSQYTSSLMSNIAKIYGFKQIFSLAFRPSTGGQSERLHRTILSQLSKMCHKYSDWPSLLPHFVYAYNSTRHSSTGRVPFELFFTHSPRLPSDSIFSRPPTLVQQQDGDLDDFELQTRIRLHNAFTEAYESLVESQRAMKLTYDRKSKPVPFSVNDRVFVFDPYSAKGPTRKLHARFKGPFTVVSTENLPNLTVKPENSTDPTEIKVVHASFVAPCSRHFPPRKPSGSKSKVRLTDPSVETSVLQPSHHYNLRARSNL